jgi:hypothetical protein
VRTAILIASTLTALAGGWLLAQAQRGRATLDD